ncbi:MAG: hypothetical protein HYV96_19955 [Opitutae bacterium]|nr:hypothetical protein [Opitutae bacterium]
MKHRDLVCASSVALLFVAATWPAASMGIDTHHDGVMLKPALDVLSGQVLFRDTFSQYGALTTYLHAVVLWFSPTLLALKWFTIAVYGMALFFLFLAWRTFLPLSLTIFASVLFFVLLPVYERIWAGGVTALLPWSSVVALLFQAIGLLALLRLVRGERSVGWSAALGTACACVFWCRMPVGVTMAGGLVICGLCLSWLRGRPSPETVKCTVLPALVAFTAINLAMLGGILLNGAGGDWWYQNFVWPGKWAQSTTGHAAPVTWRVFFPAPESIALLLLAIATGAASAHWHRSDRPSVRRIAVVAAIGFVGLLLWKRDVLFALFVARQGSWAVLVPLAIVIQAIVATVRCFRAKAGSNDFVLAAAGGFALTSLPQYFPLADPWHALWAMAPGIGVAAAAFGKCLPWRPGVVAAALAVLLVPAFVRKVRAEVHAIRSPWVRLTEPAVLRGMRVQPVDARYFQAITAAIKRVVVHRPDLSAVVVSGDPLPLCLVPNLENPTPLFVAWPGLIDAVSEQRRWSYIHAVRPLVIVHNAHWEIVDEFYRKARYAPLLYYHENALELAAPIELLEAAGVPKGGIPLPAVSP